MMMVVVARSVLAVVLVALLVVPHQPALASKEKEQSNVVVLTDETFEHDTQISSGATTGDWFIKFYAPWCGFCKSIAPEWEKLAEKLQESNVNVAKVDCTKNRATCERFGVRGYPSLFFFHNGEIYKYNGARDATSMAAYALGGWEDDEGEQAPAAPSFAQQKLLELDEILSEIHLHDDPTTNAILLGLMLAGVIAAVMIVFFITILCLCCPPESDTTLREQQQREQMAEKSTQEGAGKGEASSSSSSSKKEKEEQQQEDVAGGDRRKTRARRRKAEQ